MSLSICVVYVKLACKALYNSWLFSRNKGEREAHFWTVLVFIFLGFVCAFHFYPFASSFLIVCGCIKSGSCIVHITIGLGCILIQLHWIAIYRLIFACYEIPAVQNWLILKANIVQLQWINLHYRWKHFGDVHHKAT